MVAGAEEAAVGAGGPTHVCCLSSRYVKGRKNKSQIVCGKKKEFAHILKNSIIYNPDPHSIISHFSPPETLLLNFPKGWTTV